MNYKIENADSLAYLKTVPDETFDSLVCDPPSGISFCGNDWDKDKGGRDNWINWLSEIMAEAKRTMKAGSYGLVWALPRTSHWTATALENAGFEIRDSIHHCFSTGFPKSLDVSKAIDKQLGAERKKVKYNPRITGGSIAGADDNRPWIDEAIKIGFHESDSNEPVTDEASNWQGWGTALKPAHEVWWLVRKPLSEKNVALNVLKNGVGGINIDAGRIPATAADIENASVPNRNGIKYASGDGAGRASGNHDMSKGRFPANLILSHSPACKEVGKKIVKGSKPKTKRSAISDSCNYGESRCSGLGGYGTESVTVYECVPSCPHYELGDKARFFYCPKASKKEKNIGLDSLPDKYCRAIGDGIGGRPNTKSHPGTITKNNHPTAKPLELMRYLCRLITPPDGVVLDPFCGSGSTGVAALESGFSFVGIEQDSSFCEIARLRCSAVDALSPD